MQDMISSPALRNNTIDETEPRSLVISVEMLFYLLLIGFAIIIRMADLGSVPLSERESVEALAAWRAIYPPANVSEPVIASSALTFFTQALSFSTLGSDEFSARFFVAIAGAALCFSPLLFRAWLGRTRALLFCLLLTISPVLLITSRSTSPVTWSLVAGVLLLWGFWRWRVTRQNAYAVIAAIGGGCLLFLAEPGGMLLFAMIIAALVAAQILTSRANARYAFDAEDGSSADVSQAQTGEAGLLDDLREFPWALALAGAALVVLTITTGFLLYPQGFSIVGETFGDFFRGLSQPSPGSTFLFPFVLSVYYELFFWGFGLAAIVYLTQTYRIGFVERFFIAWLLLAIAASVVFPGALADHAAWFVVPLAGLIAPLFERLLQTDDRTVDWSVPYWSRWLVALLIFGLLLAVTLAVHGAARSMLAIEVFTEIFQDGRGALSLLAAFALSAVGVMFFILSVVFWNRQTALRGVGLGILLFGLITSLGAGWNVSVTSADKPTVFWHTTTVSPDTFLLRSTLLDLAARRTRGFTLTPLTVVGPSNGMLAWVVRDFERARFVADIAEARGDEIILIASSGAVITDLGGPYVGQDFTLRRSWDVSTLRPTEMLAWWTQGRTRFDVTGIQNAELWLRQDVYDGSQQAQIAG